MYSTQTVLKGIYRTLEVLGNIYSTTYLSIVVLVTLVQFVHSIGSIFNTTCTTAFSVNYKISDQDSTYESKTNYTKSQLEV